MSIQPAKNTKGSTGKTSVSKGVTVSLSPTRQTPATPANGDAQETSEETRLTRDQLKALVSANPAASLATADAPDSQEDDDVDLTTLGDDSEGDGDAESGDNDAEEDGVDAVGDDVLDPLSAFDNDNEVVVDEAAPDNGVLEIYRPECLQCAALVPHETKTWKKCHYSAGNERCPAQSVKIVIGIPLEKIVQAFIVSEQTGNADRSARLYKQLAEKPDWQQQQIMQGIRRRREELIKANMPKAVIKAAKKAT